jgi:hypothetical protein
MSASLQARDASGRRVSLLNSENIPPHSLIRPSPTTFSPFERRASQAFSTPATPELLRSDSYDSQRGTEPVSPITPLYEPGYLYTPSSGPEIRSPSDEYAVERPFSYEALERRPSYEADPCTGIVPSSNEQPVKRYPCRYREEYRCSKTFTTSGHASRHAKIHTAEKAVPCEFESCNKKFTRADNMKQHLETHYKTKSRSAVPRSLPIRDRRGSAARRRSLSPRPISPTEDPADHRARLAIEAQAYAGAGGLLHFPAPQVAEQPFYGQMLAANQAATTVPAMPSPAMASPTTMALDALASVALRQEEP